MVKSLREELEKAVAYGMGFVAGKHNLKVSKREVKSVSKKYVNKLKILK